MAEEPKVTPKVWDLTIKLSQPIQAHGQEVSELKLREPTAGDIEISGSPCYLKFDADNHPVVRFDEAKMTSMISALAQIPLSSVRSMRPKDWTNTAYRLAPFFLPDVDVL